MVYTKAEWDALQKRLPAADRMTYADYFDGLTAVERAQLIAREKAAAEAAAAAKTKKSEADAVAEDKRRWESLQKSLPAEDRVPYTVVAEALKAARTPTATTGITTTGVTTTGVTTTGVTTTGTTTGGVTRPPQPGSAWTWNEAQGKWVVPSKPADGKSYTWDDNKGWTVDRQRPSQPGAAWTWSEGTFSWEKPTRPAGGNYNWDDNLGWVEVTNLTTTGVTTTGLTTTGVTTTGVTTTRVTTTGVTTTISTLGATTAGVTGPTPAEQRERVSIMDTLVARFNQYGLSSLAGAIRNLALDGATEATITLALQETPEYQQRFAANQARLKNNLRVLSPAEYLNLEDGYRQVLRAYGLRQFDTDQYVRQFIENDMSAAELSDRVVTAVQRVQNADPAVAKTLRDYYGIDDMTLVAYVLDPQQQLQKIQRQVAAAEIGTAARRQGLEAGVGVAEQLAAQGITQAEAQRGYATIADILPTAEKLSAIYGDTMAGYGQSEAEQEVFNQLATAQRRREALVKREQAAFSGQAGLSRTALSQESRGQF